VNSKPGLPRTLNPIFRVHQIEGVSLDLERTPT
jgi:hypothetical protein